MAVTEHTNHLVAASLQALVEPRDDDASPTSPREVLLAVSSSWADDAQAWQLASRLIPEAETYMAQVEQLLLDRPGDPSLVRLRARARYAHIVAVTMYRDLRVRGRNAP